MTTEHNYDLLCFKKMAARFPEISGHGIQQLAEKAVNKNTVKTTIKDVDKCLEDVGRKQGS